MHLEGYVYKYTGSQIKPKVYINDDSLIEGTDYKVEYYNNINPGYKEAIAKIIGINNYTGEMEDKFSISKMIISACTFETLDEALSISKKNDCVYVTLGFHPSEALVIDDAKLKLLAEKLQDDKVVGVGEIGLDYHYGKDMRDLQIELFERQLSLAQELNLPVVIHSRDATLDTINTLKKYKVKGIIHCFSGSLEIAKEYVSLGYKLGIGGVVTFSNSKLSDVVAEIGLENIVLETDSPYLTPVPFRGKKNSSKYIYLVAKKISEIYSVSLDEVAKITTDNSLSLFDLK